MIYFISFCSKLLPGYSYCGIIRLASTEPKTEIISLGVNTPLPPRSHRRKNKPYTADLHHHPKMTSTAAPTGTSTSASASASATIAQCGATLYNIPVRDAACAVAFGGNHTSVMADCCQSADVISYADDCGLYCLAQDQTVEDLLNCMYGQGIGYSDAFCNGTANATATGTGSGTLGSGASVVASASGGSKTSGSASGSESSENAAPGAPREVGLTMGGMTVSVVLLASVLVGAFQL